MPFYKCITLAGTLAQAQKEEIVSEITRIHCEATGGLPRFVQIQFEEVKPGDAFQNGKPSRAVRLHARIRAGRDADTKHRMLHAYTDLIVRVARVPVDDVMVAFIETPFENVMEAGVRLPAPGEERAWLERFGDQSGRVDVRRPWNKSANDPRGSEGRTMKTSPPLRSS